MAPLPKKRSKAVKKVDPPSTAPEARPCWLCSKPLTSGATTTSMLAQGVFEVHTQCYEEAMGLRKRM